MSIYDEVLSFIHSPRAELFEPLALAVFRFQFDNVPVYRQFCVTRGVSPATLDSVAEIPAASTLAFKYADVRGGGPLSPAGLTFITSGTTKGFTERGRHHVPRPEIYRAAALAHLRRMLFPDGRRLAMLALHPTADRMPQSSLSTMLSWCMEEFGAGPALCAATPAKVDTAAALQFLDAAEARCDPVCILGTTAASAALFEAVARRGRAIALAAGSRLMDTGGAKGQTIPLTPAMVVARARDLLGIDPALVINEYGMTEMCSQLYDATPFNSTAATPPAAGSAAPFNSAALLAATTISPAAASAAPFDSAATPLGPTAPGTHENRESHPSSHSVDRPEIDRLLDDNDDHPEIDRTLDDSRDRPGISRVLGDHVDRTALYRIPSDSGGRRAPFTDSVGSALLSFSPDLQSRTGIRERPTRMSPAVGEAAGSASSATPGNDISRDVGDRPAIYGVLSDNRDRHDRVLGDHVDRTAIYRIPSDPELYRVKLAPPWLRPMALDPVTLRPLPAGRAGLLAFFDLANVGSISALMTEDFGVVYGDAVIIVGRAAAGGARGCALSIDEFAHREPPEQFK